jgi:hypothetical protein
LIIGERRGDIHIWGEIDEWGRGCGYGKRGEVDEGVGRSDVLNIRESKQ